MMDRFPEAFERFEREVYTYDMTSFYQLSISFRRWTGRNQGLTNRQREALKVEARRMGLKDIPPDRAPRPSFRFRTWRPERITIRGSVRRIYRDVKTGRFIKKPF